MKFFRCDENPISRLARKNFFGYQENAGPGKTVTGPAQVVNMRFYIGIFTPPYCKSTIATGNSGLTLIGAATLSSLIFD